MTEAEARKPLVFECYVFGTDRRNCLYPRRYYIYPYEKGPSGAYETYLAEFPDVCHIIIKAAIPYKEDRCTQSNQGVDCSR